MSDAVDLQSKHFFGLKKKRNALSSFRFFDDSAAVGCDLSVFHTERAF